MTREEKIARYEALLHGMQSGVRMVMEKGILEETMPKHLRVGVNTAKCDQGALVKLLIEKGVITDEDYLDAIVEMMEIEVKSYEEKLSQLLGIRVHLL